MNLQLKDINEPNGNIGKSDHNKFGQYFTPASLAGEMVKLALSIMPDSNEVRFLEPGFGHGAFFEALLQFVPKSHISKAWGYEIDPRCVTYVRHSWSEDILDLTLGDFTIVSPPKTVEEKANLILCNPPYVRHHHLSSKQKKRLQSNGNSTGVNLNGRSGLHCYFIVSATGWLAPDGIAGWLLPGEFLDADYSIPLREYLTTEVSLLRIHCFETDESLFENATVSSAIILYRNAHPSGSHKVTISFGRSLSIPGSTLDLSLSQLKLAKKWGSLANGKNSIASFFSQPSGQTQIKISDLFEIKRGLATGANDFFILTESKAKDLNIPDAFLKSILPSWRHLAIDEIVADEDGIPQFSPRFFLLDCHLPEEELYDEYPILWKYFQNGKRMNIHLRTLCKSRTPWYSQESRSPAPIICKYMGNNSRTGNKPIHFILNHSTSIATNAYHMLYPRPKLQDLLDSDRALIRSIWQSLNKLSENSLVKQGRAYGGGMVKIEPRELGKVSVGSLSGLVRWTE